MTKANLIDRLNAIAAEANAHNNGFHTEAVARDWENYGKSRTYFSLVETRDNSKHCVKKDYGYIDNQTGKYFPHKYNTLEVA